MKFIALNCLLLFLVHECVSQSLDLNYYILQAKANSPLIQDTKNQSEANKLDLERIKAIYTKPQVTFNAALALSPIINNDNGNAQLQLGPNDAINYRGYDIAASNGGIYQSMINVNQPLFNASKTKMASEQLQVAKQINQNSIQLTEHDIEKIVGDQYILCLQNMKQTTYIEQLLQLLKEQKEVVSKLAEAGLLKQSDLLLVNIEQQSQLNAILQFKSINRRDLMDLNILCGINDTAFVKLKELDLNLNASKAVSNFIEKFRLDSLNLLASSKLFELKYQPQFSSFANAGLNGVYLPTVPNRFGLSAGLNFSIYIFDGKQKYLNRRKTDYLIQSTQGYKSNFITQNTIRENKILNEIASLDERILSSKQQLADYKQLLDYYKKEVVTGQQSVTAYISTVKNLALLQRDYVLMQTNKQLLINTYNYWNW